MSLAGLIHSTPSMMPRSAAGISSCAGEVHRYAAHVLQHVAGQPRRDAEAQLGELRHRRDRLLEPAEALRAVGRVQERHHVGLQHLLVVLEVKIAPAAPHVPRELAHLVEAAARSAERRAEQSARRMLAGGVVRPPLARIDHALVDRVEDLVRIDDRSAGQHLDLQPPVRHLVDVRCELVEQRHMRRAGRICALQFPAELACLRQRRRGRRGRAGREPTLAVLRKFLRCMSSPPSLVVWTNAYLVPNTCSASTRMICGKK